MARFLLSAADLAYRAVRPLVFTMDAQAAHDLFVRVMRAGDSAGIFPAMARAIRRAVDSGTAPVTAGGAPLPSTVMIAAGLVKGDGFADEDGALRAVGAGRNIIPGWRLMPALCGAVEFGSYTRWPRPGNPGRVIWRDAKARSTQNRVGLKNPGARAAAAFLAAHKQDLPDVFGLNVAVSPGVADPAQERDEAAEAFSFFVDAGVTPAWFTLNVSCPNTEDDPRGHQTRDRTRALCQAVGAAIGGRAPLWLKISPDLGDAQLAALVETCAETGVRALVTTNTLGQPAPSDPSLTAGVGGGRLHPAALDTCQRIAHLREKIGAPLDIIGCGGALDGAAAHDFMQAGASAVQLYSALIYRGLLAASIVSHELDLQAKLHQDA